MVSIFTYRDERKLFAVIGVIIVAALIALVQIESARQGRTSPLTAAITSLFTYVEIGVTQSSNTIRGGIDGAIRTPALARENAQLRDETAHLRVENAQLAETVARLPAARDIVRARATYPRATEAMIVGFDPENKLQIVTIDKGSLAHVSRDDGVVAGEGVVGRVVEVSPLSSKVLLLVAYTSNLPAVVQRGRWWGIATGTQTRVTLHYVSQDAKLRVGDAIVTGEGRSFHAGLLIGHIKTLPPMPMGALDQTAVVEPAVAFGRLEHVLVLTK